MRVQPVEGMAARVSDLQEHCSIWGQWAMHQRINVTATQVAHSGFMAIVLPTVEGEVEPAGAAALQMSPGRVSTSWTVGQTTYSAFSNQTTESWSVTQGMQGEAIVPPGLTILRQRQEAAGFDQVDLPP